jgi:hypothetical protein
VLAAGIQVLGGGFGVFFLPWAGRDRGGGVFWFGARMPRGLFPRNRHCPGLIGRRLRRWHRGRAARVGRTVALLRAAQVAEPRLDLAVVIARRLLRPWRGWTFACRGRRR